MTTGGATLRPLDFQLDNHINLTWSEFLTVTHLRIHSRRDLTAVIGQERVLKDVLVFQNILMKY